MKKINMYKQPCNPQITDVIEMKTLFADLLLSASLICSSLVK